MSQVLRQAVHVSREKFGKPALHVTTGVDAESAVLFSAANM